MNPETIQFARSSRKYNRYTIDQERALVYHWRENLKFLESKDSRKYWKLILDAVNAEKGQAKTVQSIKKKIVRIKSKYKICKKKLGKSGAKGKRCKHYQIVDEVLGGRDVLVMPATVSTGKPKSYSSTQPSTEPNEIDQYDIGEEQQDDDTEDAVASNSETANSAVAEKVGDENKSPHEDIPKGKKNKTSSVQAMG